MTENLPPGSEARIGQPPNPDLLEETMKEIKRKTFVVKYRYGSQWFEYHCRSKDQAFKFILRKQGDPMMGVAVVKTL
jgi:hypothetical protein